MPLVALRIVRDQVSSKKTQGRTRIVEVKTQAAASAAVSACGKKGASGKWRGIYCPTLWLAALVLAWSGARAQVPLASNAANNVIEQNRAQERERLLRQQQEKSRDELKPPPPPVKAAKLASEERWTQ